LLFSDHGLSAGAVSSLFVIWSVSSFVLEVPSGAWADIVDRRTLLALSAPIYAAGFAVWIVWPCFAGFAIGFVLWGLSGALMSGTFEAWLYDELASAGAEDRFAGFLGQANAAATAASFVAIAAAAPLFAAGGYAAVGWVSVAIALVHGALALTLPAAPRAESADSTVEAGNARRGSPLLARYVAMLRAGLREATTHSGVRHLILIAAALYALTAYDEYFALVARESGASTPMVALLIALTVAGQLVGAALAGRTARLATRWLSAIIAASGALVAVGALAGHPAGFLAIAAGYGLVENAVVVSEAKLQAGIGGPARATVTSVSGLVTEVMAVAIFAAIGAGSSSVSTSTMLAVAAAPTLAIAVAARRWWSDTAPGRPE
jgi:hypothetical protein